MSDPSFILPISTLLPSVPPEDITHVVDPIDFLQDATGDLDLSTGDLQFSTGIEGVAVAQRQNLQLCLGELFTDLSKGLDYYGSILVRAPNLMLIRELIAEQLADVPFVSSIDRVALSLDGVSRTLSASCESTCDFGAVAFETNLAEVS